MSQINYSTISNSSQFEELDFESLLNSFSPPSLTNSPFSSMSSPEQQLITPQMLHNDTNDMLAGFPLFGAQTDVKVEPTDEYVNPLPSDSVFEGFSSLFNKDTLNAATSPKEDSHQPSLSPAPNSKTRSTAQSAKRTKVSMQDPIQPRNYSSASATSRKKIPAAFESRLDKKRGREEVEDDVPLNVKDAIEAKRRQNTLAARKSRERKRKELETLEGQVNELQMQNRSLVDQVERYKGIEEELRLLRMENENLKNALHI